MATTMMQVGDRARFHDGQRGTIAQVLNGGTLVLFGSDTGTIFTARADEVAPEAHGIPKAPAPTPPGEVRTVYRMDAPARMQRTPAQQQQAQHNPAKREMYGYPDGIMVAEGAREIALVTASVLEARRIVALPDVEAALRLCRDYLSCIPESAAGGDDDAVYLARIASEALAKLEAA